MNGQFSEISNSIVREKQTETTLIHFPSIRLGKRKPRILAAHSVGKTMGKQDSVTSVDIQYGTPVGKSPAKLHGFYSLPKQSTTRNLSQRCTG